MPESWMVRAGRGSRYIENFRDENVVAIGWKSVGDPKTFENRKKLAERMRVVYPDYTEQMAMVAAGQVFRFFNEIKIGDRIVTYDGRARLYLCGQVEGDAVHEPSQEIEGLTNRRKVQWEKEKARDDLSQTAQYSLGSVLTLFQVNPSVSAELWTESDAKTANGANTAVANELPITDSTVNNISESLELASYKEVSEKAAAMIADRIAALGWDQMQELVAGLLRAMGYIAEVSRSGADRGKDVIASLDGLGFQKPRIVAQVKHRRGERMGAPQLREFIGGRKAHESGLYVSTGGFTKEAYYEAERATVPLTLLDFEQLVERVLLYYPKFDEITKQLVPLRTLYWPL